MTANFGAFGASRFSRTRGRVGGTGERGINYPSPFFDIGHTYLPTTVKQMFRWCRYYFMVHPLINSVVFKMSQYPITDLVFNTNDGDQKTLWKGFMEDHLRYRSFMLDGGLDYHTYGNLLVSIFFPFKKMLSCASCNFSQPVKDSRYYFRNFEFYWECPKCRHHAPAKVSDQYIKSSKGIRLLRWNPEDVDIRYNDLNGEYTYYYEIPVQLKNDIIMGKKHIVEDVPQVFIDALRKRKAVVFSKDNIFHFKRPTLAGKDRGWGTPLLLPVLKDAFYLQILKKSQESIALEHIVPLRVLFPQAGSATSDPYTSINLGEWKDDIQEQLSRWRLDNNYIPILPLPIGNQTIGGDGRALLLGQEIRVWSEHIVTGMGVPQELVFGGLSYSGSNVSLRMLENIFIGYMTDHTLLMNWVVQRVASYMDWEPIPIKFKPFKMADDLQRKAYNFQLNQAGKISDGTLLEDSDFDPDKEDKKILAETDKRAEAQTKAQLSQAEIQGKAQMVMMRYQIKAQQEQQQMMGAGGPAPGEPGAEAEGVQQGGQSQPMGEAQAQAQAQQPQQGQPGGQQPPLPQQQMPPMMAQQPPQQAQPELPPAMGAAQSPLNQAQQIPEGAANVDLLYQAQQVASQLIQMDENSRMMALMNLRQQSPEFYQVVLGILQQLMSGGGPEPAAEPLPEQRPPQRGAETAMI
jgi:hypothetical protein